MPGPIPILRGLLYALGAALCFNVAYTVPPLGFLMIGYLACLLGLARLARPLHVFGLGLLAGCSCVAPQLAFFYGIFGPPAITLWAILAAWIAAFVTLQHAANRRLGTVRAAWLAPVLWMGMEYFRSEVYPLRFSWLNVGYARASVPFVPFRWAGMYGVGAMAVGFAAWAMNGFPRPRTGLAVIAGLAVATALPRLYDPPSQWLEVAGVQMELPSPAATIENLDALARRCPAAPLYVMSEHTFDGPPTAAAKAWCRAHGKYLIAGGDEPAPGGRWRNTAFVVGPSGEIVFSQRKVRPIQFFDDGLPAERQELWSSPWGLIGICICYDLSYRQVTDRLVAMGAQILIVPAMDAANWGAHEHALHARVAPVRAAEYGIPVFRVASSGISQAVAADGVELARAPFPGDGAIIHTWLLFPAHPGGPPLDRFAGPAASVITALVAGWLLAGAAQRKLASARPV